MARVAVVLGTRPEIIKLSGIIEGLGQDAVVLHTGQHYDNKMSQVFLDQVGCPPPEVRMDIGARTRAEQIGSGLTQLGAHLAAIEPDAVIVQGDTNSALAGALAANAGGFPLVHVEAGLRSYDRAMPEEHNRVLIDHISDLLAAPTETAVSNLAREGIAGRQVLCTGNTVVESVREQLPSAAARRALIAGFGLQAGEYIVATIHRPENTDDPAVLATIIDQLASLALPVVAPLHPRTLAAAERAGLMPQLAQLRILEPLSSRDFLALAADAAVLVSDSGGVQEEVTVLGRPLVVVRRSTERPESLVDFATLVAPGAIGDAVTRYLRGGSELRRRLAGTPSPFGDGSASSSIVAQVRARYCVPA